MASVFAVVSKKVFETQAKVSGKVLGLGSVWSTAKYASTQPALKPLGEGGHLFLVTVRPPSEALWLIAVLRDVKGVKDGWSAATNTTPITDITPLKSKIQFANGSGINAPKGKLGMSLQMPRVLADADVQLLLTAATPGTRVTALAESTPGGKTYHLNAHEKGPLPCLCVKCLDKAGERVVADGEAFVRREAKAKSRVVYYWLPEVLVSSEKSVRAEIERRMRQKLPDVMVHKPGKRKRDEEDDE